MTINDYKGPDVDIEQQLLYEWNQLEQQKYEISIRYVAAHQDSKKKSTNLTHPERMNVLAHRLSTEARIFPSQKHYHSFPQNTVDYKINSDYIQAHFAKQSSTSYNSLELRYFYQHKYKWNNTTIEKIWWQTYYKSVEKLSPSDKIRVKKFIHNRLPTNGRDNLYYDHQPGICHQ
jgi:hypothetical protein